MKQTNDFKPRPLLIVIHKNEVRACFVCNGTNRTESPAVTWIERGQIVLILYRSWASKSVSAWWSPCYLKTLLSISWCGVYHDSYWVFVLLLSVDLWSWIDSNTLQYRRSIKRGEIHENTLYYGNDINLSSFELKQKFWIKRKRFSYKFNGENQCGILTLNSMSRSFLVIKFESIK